ncbi:MAG: hypothetical protein DDT27_00303 [Dehalococcoidia bacterium]|nr:hypothetical protein [Chloroflexota bacterium]MBT9159757.1 hypothetical protein [Chloroflexota bacterium]MBT9161765.1 hypothetical protein [Chloroflexota bacterium]
MRGEKRPIAQYRATKLMKGGLRQKIIFHIRRFLGMNVFLCDSCKWDWRSACHHPGRPNATRCPDYEKRG